MIFLFSGEGPSDCGTGTLTDRVCEGEHFGAGPMICLADQLIERECGYSLLAHQCCGLLMRSARVKRAQKLKPAPGSPKLPGKKRSRETLSFRRDAQALAHWAKEWAVAKGDDVVAIFFRDTDDRRSSHPRAWRDKWEAVARGFADETFERGVPMLPRPTSEAWLLCALKPVPYRNCNDLEERSGSPKANTPLKQELAALLGETPRRELLCKLVQDGRIDANRVDMPSFNAFRDRLLETLHSGRG